MGGSLRQPELGLDADEDVLVALRDPARLAALRRLASLDAPLEEPLDRLTRLAARLLETPISFVSLVDESRQLVTSCYDGVPAEARELPLTHSVCRHVVAT